MSASMFALRFMPHVPTYRPDTVHLFCWIQSAALLDLPTPSVARQASMPADNVAYFLIKTHPNTETDDLPPPQMNPRFPGNLASIRREKRLRRNPEIPNSNSTTCRSASFSSETHWNRPFHHL